MKIQKTRIPDVVVFEPDVFGDERGFFMETFRSSWFDELNTQADFVQDNHSRSAHGILRGLHLQKQRTQGKLVRVTRGEVFDVAVDLRLESATYGQWVGEYLSADNHKIFWVPEGFAHGFVVTSDSADFLYKCTNYYDPQSDLSIAWNDKTLAIEWPQQAVKNVQLSGKDQNAISFTPGMGFKNGTWQDKT